MPEGSRAGIQSVSRAIAILKCFYSANELGLTEISKQVGLHKSTTSGLINTLKSEGFLEQDERTGKLRLGLELFSCAMSAQRGLGEICAPYLDKLLELTGETVNLAVLSKDEIVYIAKKESAHSIRISTNVGKRLPVHCTAIGKSMLAFMNQEKASALIAGLKMSPFTDNTITSKKRLLAELEIIAVEGIAYDMEEYEQGVICVAAPLYILHQNPIGAISVSGPAIRMNDVMRQNIAKSLCDITKQICGELSRLG